MQPTLSCTTAEITAFLFHLLILLNSLLLLSHLPAVFFMCFSFFPSHFQTVPVPSALHLSHTVQMMVSHPVFSLPFSPSRRFTFQGRLPSDRAGLLFPPQDRAGGTGSVMGSFLTWRQQFGQEDLWILKIRLLTRVFVRLLSSMIYGD